jgi:hypothetical protein
MSRDFLGTERPEHWAPGPALVERVQGTLRALARRWPKAMAAALDTTNAGREYLHDFAYALRDADAAVWPLLAREYMAGHEFPPGPFELRTEARRIEARVNPVAAPQPVPPPPIDHGKDITRIAEVTRVLRAELGSYQLVMLAWDHLAKVADGDPVAAQAVKTGRVTPEAVAAAIVAVRPAGAATRDGAA